MKYLIVLFLCISVVEFNQAQTVRNFVLNNLDGENVSYDELKGEQLTVIDFWASWCKPCMKGIPKINQLYKQYEERGISLISINTDGPRSISKVKPLSSTLGISALVVSDINNDVMTDLEVTQLPTLIIVDVDNHIIYRHEGFNDGDEAEIEKFILNYLNND
jgi:thiol-disulfide isomerase/thioredoxin